MKDYIKFMNGLPWIAKLLITIFLNWPLHGIYRIAKGNLIMGILNLIPPITLIFWIADLVGIILHKKITWLL